MAGPAQQITGLASGFDTKSIVEQLMAVEKTSYDKLDVKKQTEQLKLQAYQGVNTFIKKFKEAVSGLASQKLWNSKSAASTNESSLTATSSQYAVNGSYSFRVSQMASSAQFSSKGFNSKTEALGTSASDGTPNALGTITMNNSAARVDQSAKLETFNGGSGVYRGSIRITDSRGNSAIVDASGAETINDVVSAINNVTGVLVKASIGRGDDGTSYLVIEDESEGSGKMKIQNVGQGTTATDLGIAGTATDVGGSITGRNLYYMGRDTDLSLLNDGLGVEQGWIAIDVDDGTATGGVIIDANLSNARTVGDVLDTVNNSIANAIAQSDVAAAALEGLSLQLNAARNGFEFVGGKAGHTYTIGDYYGSGVTTAEAMTKPETASQLGLAGSHYVANAGDSLGGARILGDIDSPMLKNINGAYGGGIGTSSGSSPQVPIDLVGSTLLSSLNGGNGITIGETGQGISLAFFEGGGANFFSTGDIVDYTQLRALINDPTAKVDDLLGMLNQGLADYQSANNINAFNNLQFELGDEGIVLSGMSEAHQYVIQNTTLAQSLGLVRDKMGGNSAYASDIADLYDAKRMTSGAGVQIAEATTKLSELFNVTDNNPLDAANWGGLAAGSFVVTVGNDTYDFTDILKTMDGDSTVESFLSAVNAEFKAQFGDNAPQLLVDITGEGFQWRNVDLAKDLKVEGLVADQFGLEKNWTGVNLDTIGEVEFVESSLNPTATGYTESVPVTDANYDSVKLGQLYNGRGLNFTGEDNDTFEILFLQDTVDEYGIAISKTELMNALQAKAGAGNKISDLSVKDYLDTFNQVIADKIAADPALAGVEVELGLKDGAFAITKAVGLNDNDLMSFTGELSKNTTAGWGFGSGQVTSGTSFPAAGQLMGNNLGAIRYVEQDIQGLGSVTIKVGNQTYSLETDGLNGESTLRDLMEKLNSELARHSIEGVSFIMNSSGTGLAIENDSSSAVTFVDDGTANTLAHDLGFIDPNTGKAKYVDSYGYADAKSITKQYMSRATELSSLGVEAGTFVVTNARGQVVNIDVSEAKTIGDVVDALNSITNLGIRARINDAGDGITVEEWYEPGYEPATPYDGRIAIADASGSSIAKQLGLAGEGSDGTGEALSVINGSMKKTINVWSNDTLTTLMNRISQEGYKTAIVNDGSGKPFKLTISSSTTGATSDFLLDSDVELLGLSQTSRGKDAKILYGDPNSGVSPMMLSSATNSNSTAILGLTLDIKGVSDTFTTITVDTDKSAVTDGIKAMVESYNELNDFVAYLDAYDPETNEPGVLFGDSSIRNLMKSVDDMFYLVFNPESISYDEITKEEKKTWSWMDLGISFQATENTDGSSSSWYSTMALDEEALSEMVSANWEQLYNALASQTNVTDSSRSKNVAASASFNYQYDRDDNGNIIYPEGGWNANNAINGDYSSSLANGVNGFQANKTIEEGENQYTIWLQQPATLSRLSIYHAGTVTVNGQSTNGSLRDFTVEYLDANSGKWEKLREVEGNTSDASHLGFALPTAVSAIRVTASDTNASDGKFRLLDVQAIEDTGLAGKLNQLTTSLSDVTSGFMAERQTEVDEKLQELEDQMTRMQEKLDAKEALLWRQFTAMETALSQLQNQGNQISSMLSSSSS